MRNQGQSTLEFTFVTAIIVLLIYGMVRLFSWAGLDLASRRIAHENALKQWVTPGTSAQAQMQADFYTSQRIGAVHLGEFTKPGNEEN